MDSTEGQCIADPVRKCPSTWIAKGWMLNPLAEEKKSYINLGLELH